MFNVFPIIYYTKNNNSVLFSLSIKIIEFRKSIEILDIFHYIQKRR